MRQIINGKMYNTETAKHITCWQNMADRSNFSYVEEHLYLKKTGEFFKTTYGVVWHGNSGGFETNIVPLAESQAKQWCERTEDIDSYIELFGEPEE